MKSIRTWDLNPDQLNHQLYRIRAQIIREQMQGLEHINALLVIRGLEPDAFHVPIKYNPTFKRGEFKRTVISALRGGPKTPVEIWRLFGKPKRSLITKNMKRLESQGLVVMGKRGWRLVK